MSFSKKDKLDKESFQINEIEEEEEKEDNYKKAYTPPVKIKFQLNMKEESDYEHHKED